MALALFSPMYSEALWNDGNCCDNTCVPNTCCEETCCREFSVEAQFAAYFPLDSTVGHIYGYALPAFTLEASWQWQCMSIWLDGSYIFGSGHSIGCGGGPTHLNFVPITLGVKYIYPMCDSTDLYIGLGACYSFLNTRDHSEYVHENTSGNNAGAILKTGVVYHYCDGIFFEGFFNYQYQKFYFHKTETNPFVYRHDVDMSNLQLGVAVGWEF